MIPSERIGGNRNHDQIKSHHFFKGIEWDTLENQKPPPILTYFDKVGGVDRSTIDYTLIS